MVAGAAARRRAHFDRDVLGPNAEIELFAPPSLLNGPKSSAANVQCCETLRSLRDMAGHNRFYADDGRHLGIRWTAEYFIRGPPTQHASNRDPRYFVRQCHRIDPLVRPATRRSPLVPQQP